MLLRIGSAIARHQSTFPWPRWLGGHDTAGFAINVAWSGKFAFVADDAGGVEILDVSDPALPRWVASEQAIAPAVDLVLSGNRLYVAGADAGLHVLDVSDPAQPKRIGGNTSLPVLGLALSGPDILAAGGSDGFSILGFASGNVEIETPVRLSSGGLKFRVLGPAGRPIKLERSADMQQWEPWKNVVLPGGPLEIIDLDAAHSPVRFYRAVSP